jgi:hypothetical protein
VSGDKRPAREHLGIDVNDPEPPKPDPPKVHKRKPLSETKVGARVLHGDERQR